MVPRCCQPASDAGAWFSRGFASREGLAVSSVARLPQRNITGSVSGSVVLFCKPAVCRHSDAGVASVEWGDLVEDVGGEDHELARLEPQVARPQCVRGLQARDCRIREGIRAGSGIKEPEGPAAWVLG